MATRATNTLISDREMLVELAILPFRKIGEWLTSLAESNSRTAALQAIADLSEEELAAKGTTRAELISQTFRHDG